MSRSDTAWLEVQYNNRARVPEHPAILKRWALASARVRAASACVVDLPYGPGPGETLDLFTTTRPRAPVLVFVHGGWWRSLDKRDHSFIAAPFTQAGALVVVPNYALCPVVTIETIAWQTARAIAWVHRHAARHGGDPARIVVAGHSAGGHLAAMLLACRWRDVASDLPDDVVGAALSISGLFDLEPLRRTPSLQYDLRLTRASVRRLSPAGFAPPRGPLFAAVGAAESEEFLRQNLLIRQRWGTRTVPVCEAITGCDHFTVLDALADPRARLHRLALQLLEIEAPPATTE
jgi:arylformamidase